MCLPNRSCLKVLILRAHGHHAGDPMRIPLARADHSISSISMPDCRRNTGSYRPNTVQTDQSLGGFKMPNFDRVRALASLPKIIGHLQAEPHLRT
jgi:hypothetical protein